MIIPRKKGYQPSNGTVVHDAGGGLYEPDVDGSKSFTFTDLSGNYSIYCATDDNPSILSEELLAATTK